MRSWSPTATRTTAASRLPRSGSGHPRIRLDGLRGLAHTDGGVAGLRSRHRWTVEIGPVRVELTPADHAWRNASPGASDRVFQPEDACGFCTPDGTIWAPGDSRLIPDHHLRMPNPGALLFDFCDSEWHFGLEGAARTANAYPKTPLLLHHWVASMHQTSPPSTATRPRSPNLSRIQTGYASWHRVSPLNSAACHSPFYRTRRTDRAKSKKLLPLQTPLTMTFECFPAS